MRLKTMFIIGFSFSFLFAIILGGYYYKTIFAPNVTQDASILIPSNAQFEKVNELVSPLVINPEYFRWVARQKKYTTRIKGGKYNLKAGMSNNELVNLLRSGNQSPVKITFNNQERLNDLAGRIAKQIETDSADLIKVLRQKDFLHRHGFNEETALGMYIPNSYEAYWTITPEAFRQKMFKEYHKFWTQDRVAKAQKNKLTINQVITLASIVQKETSKSSERAIVAGLYLNRLKKNIPLQADPTVIYALKKVKGWDYKVRRVLRKDLKIKSPYNTYKNRGLPPGPICMPDVSSIKAVLNPKKHSYFYMCASVEHFGTHVFAETLQQHNENARNYRKWLNKKEVYR